MGYKMKQDESPAKNLDFLTTSGTGGGYINPAQQSSAAGAAAGGFNTGGAGAITGLAGGLVDQFGESDPTKGGYVGTQATSKALEYAGMGAMLGPYGMAAGALIGAGVGVFGAKKERKEAEKQQLIQEQNEGMSEAKQQLMKNKMGITKKGTIKKLGAITGTISPNMSMAQYKDEMKFSAIARNIDEPIMNLGFIKAKTLEKSDFRFRVQMNHAIESLNISNTVSVVCHHIFQTKNRN